MASLALAGCLILGANITYADTLIADGANLNSYAPIGSSVVWTLQGNAALFGAGASTAVGLPSGSAGLTINGAPGGSTITLNNGSGNHGYFSGNGATLNLSDVTLAGGNQDSGGAIRDAGNLTINTDGTVALTGNSANWGGAIQADNGNVNIAGGSILLTNNAATNGGGAINAAGGVTLGSADGTLELSGNTANGQGGAIRALQGATLTGQLITLDSNRSGSNGGAIYAEQGHVQINGDLTATGNSAGAWGGVIDSEAGDVNVTGNSILLSGNTAGAGGGAINAKGNVMLGTSGGAISLLSNSAQTSGGGAVRAIGSVTVNGDLTANDNSAYPVIGIAGAASGGAIYAHDGSVVVNGNLSAQGNSAGSYGGVLHSEMGDVVATGGSISLIGNSAGAGGGALNAGGDLSLGNAASTIMLSGNSAIATDGGALRAVDNITLYGTLTATDNTAGSNGGAIYTEGGDVVATSDVLDFSGNTAGVSGGAISAGGSLLLGTAASTVVLADNTATLGDGGAVQAAQDVVLNGTLSATGNMAGGSGGAIHASAGSVQLSGDLTLSGNRAAKSGGAIYAESNAILSGNAINLTDNKAGGGGGAIYAYAGDILLQGTVTATGNQAGSFGGALDSEQAISVTGDSLSFSGNTAGTGGGAINAGGDIALGTTVSTVTLTNNTTTAGDGGAIRGVQDVTLLGNLTASGNSAGGSGGVIYAVGDVAIANTVGVMALTGNSAGSNGGVIAAEGNVTLTGATLSNNAAAGNGGALWARGNVSLHTINGGITFSGNQQGSGANAIWMDNSSTSGTPSVLTLDAAGNAITFYDPVQSNAANGLVSVIATGGDSVIFDGAQYSSANDRWSRVFGSTEVQNSTTLAIQNNAVYGLLGGDVNQTERSSFLVGSGATLAGGTQGTVRADDFTLGGRLNIAGTAAQGTELGGYSTFNVVSSSMAFGAGSQVLFNTYLNDASTQLTDLLSLDLNQGTGTGSAAVLVNNTGGAGGLTQGDGIEIIQVSGVSEASFALAAPVQAGAYEYQLFQGSVAGGGNNWYLRSSIESTDPVDPGTPTDPSDPGTPTDPSEPGAPTNPGKPGTPIYRPGTANYVAAQTANMEQGMTLLSTLHQRMGGTYDLKSDERQGWSRLYSDNLRADGDRFNFKQDLVGIQFGHDLWVEGDGQGNTKRAGVVIDYTRGNADFADEQRVAAGFGRKHTGRLESDTLSVGGYGTFSRADGSYMDNVAMISHIRNGFDDVYDDHATQTAWRLGLSTEVGKPIARIGEDWQVEPQAQLSYQRTWYKGFHDGVGKVGSYQADSLRGRIGARVFNDAVHPQNQAQVYAVANVIHDFIDPESVNVGGTRLREDYDKTFGELGVGGRFKATENTTIFGDTRFRQSFDGDSKGAAVNLGIQVNF